MPFASHHFALDLRGPDGADLGRHRLDVDWGPAVECAHFAAIRRGELLPTSSVPTARIEPVWHAERGRPTVGGLNVVLEPPRAAPVGAPVSLAYLAAATRTVAAGLVAEGRLEAGDDFDIEVVAFPADPPEPDDLVVEPVEQPLALADTPFDELAARSRAVGDTPDDAVAVFLPHRVLEETREQTRAAGDVEMAALLVGRLHRDRGQPARVFLEITAQIPAQHTNASSSRVELTPATWSHAEDVLRLRGRGEALVGWAHSHPDWCRTCADDRRAVCPLNKIFFSGDDCALHRTVFPRAYHVALLLSDRDGAIVPCLFGWQDGTIAARGFHLLDAPAAPSAGDAVSAASTVPVTVGGHEHAHDPSDPSAAHR